jgi:hypothetical protein
MADNDQKISLTEVRGRLFELIFEMAEADSRALKEELEKGLQPEQEQKERRKHPRKNSFINVDCSGNKCAFTDFIQNISDSGLYIETQMPLFPDQELSLTDACQNHRGDCQSRFKRHRGAIRRALRPRSPADSNLLNDFSYLIDQQRWKMKILGG